MSTSVVIKPEIEAISQDNYLLELLRQVEENSAVIEDNFLEELRQKATSEIVNLTIPTKDAEEWRFTDLSELVSYNFISASPASLFYQDILSFKLPETESSKIVFVNGFYTPELSNISALNEEIFVGNLGDLTDTQKEKIVKYLGHPKNQDVFSLLNTAGIKDVAVIWASENAHREADPFGIATNPIQLLFLTAASDNPSLSQPRVLVIAERGASLEIVEHYGAINVHCNKFARNHPYFTNAVSEIYLEDGAQINHSRIQQESVGGFHIAKTVISQGKNSRYTGNEISLGGKLYRHTLEIYQTGEQTETYLNGLTVIGGKQVSDTHSAVFLNYPHGTTDQLHKCIIDDSAHAVFNGKIFVPKPAQLTNAAQLNRNLLLSGKARVNTKPELQITADNVKCSHGATVSQLEADELFYLRSRGLTEDNARHLLIDAFSAEILDRLPASLPSLRHHLSQCVACRNV